MTDWRVASSAFLIGLGCWAGLGYLVTYYVPDTSTVTLALFLILVGTGGTVMPALNFLDHRFHVQAEAEEERPTDRWRVIRQSVLISLLVALCLWFQLLKVLNWLIVVLLVGVVALIELFFDPQQLSGVAW